MLCFCFLSTAPPHKAARYAQTTVDWCYVVIDPPSSAAFNKQSDLGQFYFVSLKFKFPIYKTIWNKWNNEF